MLSAKNGKYFLSDDSVGEKQYLPKGNQLGIQQLSAT